MLPVFPVYPYSLCMSSSTHEGALPSPAYPYFANNNSTEVHPVVLIPGPWVKKTTKVFCDANALILDGHNTGMMIPHLSPIMDNLMLPLTMLGSSCSWPFRSFKVESEGKGLIGFFPAYAPFVYCDSPKEGKSSSDAAQPKPGAPKSPDLGERALAAKERMGTAAKAKLPGRAKLKAIGDKTGFKMSISGRGRVYIPACKTIMMRMNLAELLIGWATFLAAKALDALVGAAFKQLPTPGTKHLSRLDSDVARRRALETFSKNRARVLSAAARKEVMQHIAQQTTLKVAKDGIAKSLVLDSKIKAPYGLFSYSFADQKGKFLWWGEFEAAPLPIEWRGLRGETMKALDQAYQPPVEALIADNPNHASATSEAEAAP